MVCPYTHQRKLRGRTAVLGMRGPGGYRERGGLTAATFPDFRTFTCRAEFDEEVV